MCVNSPCIQRKSFVQTKLQVLEIIIRTLFQHYFSTVPCPQFCVSMTSYPGRRSFETLLQPINTKIFIVSNARGYTPSCGYWHHGLAPRGVEMESNSARLQGLRRRGGGGGIRAGAGDIFLLYPALVKNISFKTKHVHNFVKQRYLHRQLRALPQTNTL